MNTKFNVARSPNISSIFFLSRSGCTVATTVDHPPVADGGPSGRSTIVDGAEGGLSVVCEGELQHRLYLVTHRPLPL
ncbi:hypothetical protein Taro_050177 [Colocasia esculenta]|uniref:Uncharacterized protein n=1 Tax=Colocasia esculenta TaxID=4460 RepID=A0A843XD58_COLES|nr:hypothetical protein [Colocasia esculenta]